MMNWYLLHLVGYAVTVENKDIEPISDHKNQEEKVAEISRKMKFI
jgi:hypothetical protein